MKTVGRIILAVVGIIMIGIAVPNIIQTVQAIQALPNGWQDLFKQTTWELFTSLLSQGFNALVGLTAVFAALRGSAGFWLTVFSIVQIAGVIWYFYTANQAGTLGDWKNILNTILGFASPILYFIGSLLIRFNK